MRKTMLAVAAVLSIGAVTNEAAAMPAAMPAISATQLGLATSADANLVQKAAVVCGYYGCRRVWWNGPYWRPHHWGWQHSYWGWRRW
ncbi:MAG TPA: hypothetical protein VMA30_22095 [Xanthobacteraceae bacterium]|nr:hypothetical protein [Xanthobacteraceae bacterium]